MAPTRRPTHQHHHARHDCWGVVAFLVALRTWANKDKVDNSAAGAEIAYNKAAQGIVERLERELVEVHQQLDGIAERERDGVQREVSQSFGRVMLEILTKMLTVGPARAWAYGD